MMRRSTFAILTLCAVPLLALALGLPATAAEESAEKKTPKAVVVEPVKDFGELTKGDKVTHDFLIKNEGNAELQITRVSPECGCTVAEFDRSIPPGGTGKIHAIVDTATLAGPTAKRITVFTNDPSNPDLLLTFKAKVTPYLWVHPGYARYITVRGEQERGVIKQVVWAEDVKNLEVVEVDSPLPYLKVDFRPAREDEKHKDGKGMQWVVEMELLYNEAPIGPVAEHLVIRTNHPKQKETLVPVSGFVRPSMWVTPDKVNLGSVKLEEPLEFSLTLQNFLSTPLKITGVESTLQGVEAKVSPIEEGRKYNVDVTLKPGLPQGSFDGKLLIHTTTPTKSVVEVPVRGTVL